MARLPLAVVSVAILGAAVRGQADMSARLLPITSAPRHAGVYHVATGTWTRGATLANVTGPDTIYNNTCAEVYFTGMISQQRFQHRSRIPSTTGPTTDSIFYGSTSRAHRYDERPGCRDAYTVNGFQVAYCSSHAGTVTWEYQFASSYTACAATAMVPQYTITVTGLPGGTPTGSQCCWVIDIDLSGEPGGGMVLSADGDGDYDGPSTMDQFGWSFRTTSTFSDNTGPIIAGDFTWTGGPNTVSGVLTPCTGTDGTMWDSTIDPNESGTGMASSNFFRCENCPGPPSSPICLYFGGNPHADFHLKLYADVDCSPPDPVVKFCAPGVGGVITCPCGNPQVPAGSTKGCDNFAGGGTGGAILSGSGVASIAADTLGFDFSAGVGSSVTVLFQGTTGTVNNRTGAGVRCVGGALVRLYKGNEVAGSISFPNIAVSVHDRSFAKGFVITAPMTLYYYCAYRNSAANGQPGCPGLNFGFNASNAGAVSWGP